MSPVLKAILIGIAVTPLCLLLALISAGAGHGDYVMARLLYPYSMLLAGFTGSLSLPHIFFALVQFPVYGWIIGWARSRGTRLHVVAGGFHLACVLATFSGLMQNFV